jgi:hypothetical protein
MFTNTAGRPVHAESISQLFDRHLARTGLARIRFVRGAVGASIMLRPRSV